MQKKTRARWWIAQKYWKCCVNESVYQAVKGVICFAIRKSRKKQHCEHNATRLIERHSDLRLSKVGEREDHHHAKHHL